MTNRLSSGQYLTAMAGSMPQLNRKFSAPGTSHHPRQTPASKRITIAPALHGRRRRLVRSGQCRRAGGPPEAEVSQTRPTRPSNLNNRRCGSIAVAGCPAQHSGGTSIHCSRPVAADQLQAPTVTVYRTGLGKQTLQVRDRAEYQPEYGP